MRFSSSSIRSSEADPHVLERVLDSRNTPHQSVVPSGTTHPAGRPHRPGAGYRMIRGARHRVGLRIRRRRERGEPRSENSIVRSPCDSEEAKLVSVIASLSYRLRFRREFTPSSNNPVHNDADQTRRVGANASSRQAKGLPEIYQSLTGAPSAKNLTRTDCSHPSVARRHRLFEPDPPSGKRPRFGAARSTSPLTRRHGGWPRTAAAC